MIGQILPNNNGRCYSNFSPTFLEVNTPYVTWSEQRGHTFFVVNSNLEIQESLFLYGAGKKNRPVESEISEISRLPARSEIFPLSSEIFIFLKFCYPNRRQSPLNTLTLIHV
jgi:hypothetical protein